ncbi:hypothetical protein RhiJN_14594 [Ceratobasidium sp. AG-Ba]|nr:hypothetical protein RhiJN_14594 [Ceratobasidium sp. AG-Ba]
MANTREQKRKSERKERNKHARADSDASAPEVKSKRVKLVVSNSEDELEAGVFANTTVLAPTELEDEDEEGFSQAEHEEFLQDPDADREASSPVEEQPVLRTDSTDPEPIPRLDLVYLIPKSGSSGATPCQLHTHVSFHKFRKLLAQSINKTDLDEILVHYRFNNQPANHRPQCLDTLDEYQHMIREVCAMLSTLKKSQKSPAPIQIFCKKRDPTPEPVQTKKCSSKSKGRTSNSGKDGDSDHEDNKTWKILRDLRKEHSCLKPGHSICYKLDNICYPLTPQDLSMWATVVQNNKATISEPPSKLKLSFLDKVPKARGNAKDPAPVPAPVPIPAPAPAPVPAPVPNPLMDPAAMGMFLASMASFGRLFNPAPPLPPPAELAAPAPATEDDKNNHMIDFPTISVWLDSINDLHPKLNLPSYATTLEDSGFILVNHLVLPDLTPQELSKLTKINFVVTSVLIRRAKEIVKEMRSLHG